MEDVCDVYIFEFVCIVGIVWVLLVGVLLVLQLQENAHEQL